MTARLSSIVRPCSPDPPATAGGSDRYADVRLRLEALAVLDGLDERLDHLGRTEVAVEIVELLQPEVIAHEARVGVPVEAHVVRVPTQIPEILHQHEGAIL